MGKDNRIDTGTAASVGGTDTATAASFALNPADYSDDLAKLALTEEQGRIFLETLLPILSAFVELGSKGDAATILCKHFLDVSRSGTDAVELTPSPTITGAPRSGKDTTRHE